MVLESGCQLAGQTSPCFSTNWNALISLNVSSTLLPTGKSFMLNCLNIPSLSIMKRPRKAIPDSWRSTLYLIDISLLKSLRRG